MFDRLSRGVRLAGRILTLSILTPAAALVASGPAHAHKIPVLKDHTHSALRSADGRVEATAGVDLPERPDRHSHLSLGEPLTPLFERRELERRASVLRSGPDTLVVKVAVLRVEFASDRLGDQTTGDGRMMRENLDPENVFIDPPPHNEAYFQKHIEAVDRYWRSMTWGCVRIEGEVFPRGEEFGAYELTDMADYGPEDPDDFFSIPGLIRYSRESLMAADADPDLVWGDYDVYWVAHAGSDWQNDVLRNTPFDLPTFSISFSDSEVVVSDEGDTLTTMITFPETSSQDGFNVALNGGVAHEMGHQLGLLDIYNVETFAPTVAFYDVMDSGNLASVFVPHPVTEEPTQVIGVLPSAVGAWSRWLITFRFGLNPEVIKTDRSRVRLRAIQSRIGESVLPADTYKWIQIPVSETEYFLVENRVDDLDGRDADGNFLTALDQDDSTGVVVGPIHFDTDEISHNYDLLIDPGILIWHVDERQALANLTQGRGLNVNFEKRSVTIEEADGIVDIGNPFSFFPLGTANEAFHAGNNANFTSTTMPSSNTNLGPPSNVSIRNIGARDSTVSMVIELGTKPPGWPMEVGPYGTGGGTATTVADVDRDGRFEIAVSADSAAFVFDYDDADGDGEVDFHGAWPQPVPDMRLFGRPSYTQALGQLDADPELEIVAVTDSGSVYCWDGDGVPFAAADSTGALLAFGSVAPAGWSPVPADLDTDGVDELYLVTLDGRLRGYDLSAGAVTEAFPARRLLGDTPVDTLFATVAVGDLNADGRLDGLVVFAHDGVIELQTFDRQGNRPPPSARPKIPVEGLAPRERVFVGIADLLRQAGNNDPEIVLATEAGWVAVVSRHGEIFPGWPVSVNGPIGGPPAFGDLDGDGLLEIALSSGNRSLHAFNYNGTQMPGWPVLAKLADFPGSGRPPSSPVIADVDGDGSQDVVAGFVDFTVRAFARDGALVPGFPIPGGAAVRMPPAILDANGDGRLDLFFQANDGTVYARVLAGVATRTNPQWPMMGGGPRLQGRYHESRLPDAIGPNLSLLQGPVQVFPNPVGTNHSEVTIRYTLGPNLDPATGVAVTLYNVAGEIVLEMDGPAAANTENIVRVPSEKLASGIYFCSVRARSGTREADHIGKFAVIR